MCRISIPSLIITAALIGAAVGALLAYGVLSGTLESEMDARLASFQGEPASAENPPVTGVASALSSGRGTPGALDPEERIVTEVYGRLSPSVVHISTIQYARAFMFPFYYRVVPQEGTGSGFIFSEDGYILTNNHVVAGAREITVRMYNGEEYNAELVGTDRMTELAVLHVRGVDIRPEWVAPLGDSDALRVGQRAIAIGNPFGLDSTVTVGVISALNRPLTIDGTTFDSMIQTDASINPGNSGGPLINSSGEVIGINTVIISQSGGSHGVGFAIPINIAGKITDDLIQYGRVRRPSVGFGGLTLTPDLAEALGLPVSYGVLVQEVQPGSAAWEAGLSIGEHQVPLRDNYGRRILFYAQADVIVALNRERVDDFHRLVDRIRRMELGAEVTLRVIRGGEEIELAMVLSE